MSVRLCECWAWPDATDEDLDDLWQTGHRDDCPEAEWYDVELAPELLSAIRQSYVVDEGE